MITKEFFTSISGKKVSVLGAERSGIGAARLLKRLGAHPFVSDFGPAEKLSGNISILKDSGIDFETGGHTEKVFDCEFIIISPGVPSTSPVVLKAKEKGLPLISEMEFASYFCKGTIIAITGTNGKSTTTAFINYLLNSAGKYCVAAGNIGKAFSDVTLDIPEGGFVSLEVSSFQLDHTLFFKPRVSMILNITPDHLNRYNNNIEEYAASKYSIFANQDENDLLILNADSEFLSPAKVKSKSAVNYFSLSEKPRQGAYLKDGSIIVSLSGEEVFRFNAKDLFIRGEHNIANAMASILAVHPFIAGGETLKSGLASFKGIPHRLELVRELGGVKYVNDSKATNVDSVWYALRSFDVPVFLILGGKDKGNDYNQIKQLVLDKVKKIYAIGESAETVFKFFHKQVKVEIKESLDACIKSANGEARSGEVVLLSPACASFDMFRDYEQRGDVFREIVERLVP